MHNNSQLLCNALPFPKCIYIHNPFSAHDKESIVVTIPVLQIRKLRGSGMNVPKSQSWEREPGFQSQLCGSDNLSNVAVPTLDLTSEARLLGDLGVPSAGLQQTSSWAAGRGQRGELRSLWHRVAGGTC